MAFSPDSRWLFVIAGPGTLYAMDVTTGAMTDLTAATGGALPPLSQLAVRSTRVGSAP